MNISKKQDICAAINQVSQYAGEWRLKQDEVKEESITDWILYQASQISKYIKYKAFSRHEEGRATGADWEWWFLYDTGVYYKFRVQSKKAREGYNHSSSIMQTNKTGYQIDMFINDSINPLVNATPVYAFYTKSTSFTSCGRNPVEGIAIMHGFQVRDSFHLTITRAVSYNDIIVKSIAFSCLSCCLLQNEGVNPAFIFRDENDNEIHRSMPELGFHDTLPDYVEALLSQEEERKNEDVTIDTDSNIDFRQLLVFDMR